MMRFILVILMSAVSMVGCSSDSGGSGNAGGNPKQFGGPVTDLNGNWFGRGTVIIDGEKNENMDFRVAIAQIPARLSFRIDITSKGRMFFNVEINDLGIQGNSIVAPVNGEIGSIGSNGFIFADVSSNPQISAKANLSGLNMSIVGSYESKLNKVNFVGQVAR